jgi:hypothetical protein
MGIDLAQPAEVSSMGERGALIIYHGWYHFVGTIQSGRSGWRATSPTGASADFERLSSTCEVGLSPNRDLLSAAFGDLPVVQLDFSLDAPWVLTDSPNYHAAV